MYVVATAGHVDHGKSTLVKAITGMEPDRWAEERRRGLTIDLGFVWTTLDSGREVAFVDVPGHERFIGNMLAGLGPVPVVCFVVAADEGWRQQSSDHRDAIAALEIEHGLIVVTRTDLAPDRVPEVVAQAREGLAGTGLADAPAIAVSALSGDGIDAVRAALDDLLGELPAADSAGRARIWVDRSFVIDGAGTVVTGTLPAGTVTVGDRLDLLTADGSVPVSVRGLQHHGHAVDEARPVSRVAVNLRGVAAGDVRRGDVLVTPGAWRTSGVVDVTWTRPPGDVPEWSTVHAGAAAVPARIRPLGDRHARITLARSLPLTWGDRLVVRDPGAHRIVGGCEVADVRPPTLTRRGDAARRVRDLDAPSGALDTVRRAGAVPVKRLQELGFDTDTSPDGVRAIGRWWVSEEQVGAWEVRLRGVVADGHARDPLAAGVTFGAAVDALALPDRTLLAALVDGAGVTASGGVLTIPEHSAELGPAERGVTELERRLRESPFAAPESDDLAELGLGARELAAAERVGRLLRLGAGVVLLPSAPALAMRRLVALPQPFTTSQARQALETTRRVAVPLLEHIDGRGWTRRLDAGHRVVVR